MWSCSLSIDDASNACLVDDEDEDDADDDDDDDDDDEEYENDDDAVDDDDDDDDDDGTRFTAALGSAASAAGAAGAIFAERGGGASGDDSRIGERIDGDEVVVVLMGWLCAWCVRGECSSLSESLACRVSRFSRHKAKRKKNPKEKKKKKKKSHGDEGLVLTAEEVGEARSFLVGAEAEWESDDMRGRRGDEKNTTAVC